MSNSLPALLDHLSHRCIDHCFDNGCHTPYGWRAAHTERVKHVLHSAVLSLSRRGARDIDGWSCFEVAPCRSLALCG